MSNDALKTVLLAIAGSDAAFAELVQRRQGALVGLLTRVCGERGLAEDVAQTAFVKAWRNIHALRDANRFDAWLRQIAMRTAVDALRARWNLEPLEEASGIAEEHADADLRLDVDAALQRLSAAQRACVLLAYGEGLSHAEIAEELGIPIGTVKSHVARGAKLLRRVLEGQA
ncbi:MAG: RNA polymerase sigma factor [Vitreimonas sp.]